jgi:hypothetical protein
MYDLINVIIIDDIPMYYSDWGVYG